MLAYLIYFATLTGSNDQSDHEHLMGIDVSGFSDLKTVQSEKTSEMLSNDLSSDPSRIFNQQERAVAGHGYSAIEHAYIAGRYPYPYGGPSSVLSVAEYEHMRRYAMKPDPDFNPASFLPNTQAQNFDL